MIWENDCIIYLQIKPLLKNTHQQDKGEKISISYDNHIFQPVAVTIHIYHSYYFPYAWLISFNFTELQILGTI